MKPKSPVSKKISEMVGEGYKPKVAVAAALSMQRRGKLSPTGSYRRRTHREKRGPVGRQRAL